MLGFNKTNVNPKGIINGDCVVRALAAAMDKTWDEVYLGLSEVGFKMKRVMIDKKVSDKYLELNGWIKQKQPRRKSGGKYLLNDMDEILRKDQTAVVSVRLHLTVVRNHEIVDTWDCGRRSVGSYWLKEQ